MMDELSEYIITSLEKELAECNSECSSCLDEGDYDVCECCPVWGTARDLERQLADLREE